MGDLGKKSLEILKEIAVHGADLSGGVTRFLYSDAWKEAQLLVKNKMESSGLLTSFDEIGNLFGRIQGAKYTNETILTGSHIDTVRNGGMYDGQYGVVASFLAIEYLKEKYGTPLRSLEVVSFAEEEGSRFSYTFWGSKNLCGIAKKEDVLNLSDEQGVLFLDAMKQQGFKFRNENEVPRNDIVGFLEIHIEQGKVLEAENLEIGVVKAIAGQRRFNIEVTGEANHAGTTPMGLRKDAVYSMSLMVKYLVETALKYGDPLVATIGKIVVRPNTSNVVPGYVLFTLDARHTDDLILKSFTNEVLPQLNKIAKANHTTVVVNMWMDVMAVPMNISMVDILENACKVNQVSYKIMHSGAGHDSMIIAPFVPTAMLFVPSKLGISHSPDEFTNIEFLEKGILVLAEALYRLAYLD